MSFIGSSIADFSKGDWLRGLTGIVTAGMGTNIVDMARGNKSIGEGIADQAASAVSAAANVVAPGSGMLVDMGYNTTKGAVQGQSTGEIMKNNALSAVGSVVGAGVSKVSSNTGNSSTSSTFDKSLKTEVKVPNMQQAMNQITGKTDLVSNLKTKLPSTGGTPSQTLSLPSNTSQTTSTGNKLVNFAKKNITVSGVAQTALSGASAIQGAKQANASNKIAQQSLLFQKQSFEAAQEEKNTYKVGMKQTAQTAYESAQLFGSELYGSTSNTDLFTGYSTRGDQGNISLISWSPKSDKT